MKPFVETLKHQNLVRERKREAGYICGRTMVRGQTVYAKGALCQYPTKRLTKFLHRWADAFSVDLDIDSIYFVL